MGYEGFQEEILRRLKDFYGKDVDISVSSVLKNNGKKCDAVYIYPASKKQGVIPVIYIEEYYEMYKAGTASMEECIGAIVEAREQNEVKSDVLCLSGKILDWDSVKDKVYPILLLETANQELLEEVVSTRMLDLAIVYIVREEMEPGGWGSVKISRQLLENFGISKEQLHEQAMHNLEQDGYVFLDLEQCVFEQIGIEEIMEFGKESIGELQEGKIYILRNKSGLYGAAGILNQKFLRECTKGKSCYILPSSVHETIFIPTTSDKRQKELDDMVAEINVMQVKMEERLSDHSYYYDAKREEIRILD